MSIYVKDSSNTLTIEVLINHREKFFGSTFSTDAEENYYQQWSSAVDVATFIPLVFSGDPSVYESEQHVSGDSITETDSRLGAVCKDSSTLVFVFYDHARAPSDVYWYSLVDHSPGGIVYMELKDSRTLGDMC